jgi:heme exporter protein C
MAPSMLWPLLLGGIGGMFGFGALVTARLRAAVMERRIRALTLAQVRREAE